MMDWIYICRGRKSGHFLCLFSMTLSFLNSCFSTQTSLLSQPPFFLLTHLFWILALLSLHLISKSYLYKRFPNLHFWLSRGFFSWAPEPCFLITCASLRIPQTEHNQNRKKFILLLEFFFCCKYFKCNVVIFFVT